MGGLAPIQEGYRSVIKEEVEVVANLIEFRADLNHQKLAVLQMSFSNDKREQHATEKEIKDSIKGK